MTTQTKSSEEFEEIKRMQPLYHSLANLFQFLGDDELKQEINKCNSGTVRKFYEDVLADTKKQRKGKIKPEN